MVPISEKDSMYQPPFGIISRKSCTFSSIPLLRDVEQPSFTVSSTTQLYHKLPYLSIHVFHNPTNLS